MKTLAKVGSTSNSLWWAMNGVSLLFAVQMRHNGAREHLYRHASGAMAEQLCSNPLRNNFVEGKIWDHPQK